MGAIRGKRKRVMRIMIQGPKSRKEVLELRAALKKVAAKYKAKIAPRPGKKKGAKRPSKKKPSRRRKPR